MKYIALATLLLLGCQQKEPLPVYHSVSSFQLINSSGDTVSNLDLLGKVWVADFVFTTCSGPCPVMTTNLAWLHRSYRLDDRVRLVSISVNPEYDTPEVLNEYAESFDANTDHWWFLTGNLDSIHHLAVNGFKIGSLDEPLNHSTYFCLVDQTGRIRGFFDGTDETARNTLFNQISQLLDEG